MLRIIAFLVSSLLISTFFAFSCQGCAVFQKLHDPKYDDADGIIKKLENTPSRKIDRNGEIILKKVYPEQFLPALPASDPDDDSGVIFSIIYYLQDPDYLLPPSFTHLARNTTAHPGCFLFN